MRPSTGRFLLLALTAAAVAYGAASEPQGRDRKPGDACVWDANDSGPNQCNPKKPK